MLHSTECHSKCPVHNLFKVLTLLLFVFQVKWYRDTMLLDANENRLMEQYGFRHSMVIRSAAKADFGNYSCSAENTLGRSRAFIEVSGKRSDQSLSL